MTRGQHFNSPNPLIQSNLFNKERQGQNEPNSSESEIDILEVYAKGDIRIHNGIQLLKKMYDECESDSILISSGAGISAHFIPVKSYLKYRSFEVQLVFIVTMTFLHLQQGLLIPIFISHFIMCLPYCEQKYKKVLLTFLLTTVIRYIFPEF
jgi:hypothetical protein